MILIYSAGPMLLRHTEDIVDASGKLLSKAMKPKGQHPVHPNVLLFDHPKFATHPYAIIPATGTRPSGQSATFVAPLFPSTYPPIDPSPLSAIVTPTTITPATPPAQPPNNEGAPWWLTYYVERTPPTLANQPANWQQNLVPSGRSMYLQTYGEWGPDPNNPGGIIFTWGEVPWWVPGQTFMIRYRVADLTNPWECYALFQGPVGYFDMGVADGAVQNQTGFYQDLMAV